MERTRLRQLAILIALYVALPTALVSALLVGWMVAVENATVVLQSADSPDGRYRAEVVRVDPGASSGYEYMVRVMPSGLTPLARSLRVLPFGPVYVALDAHREPDKLEVRWSALKEVAISCRGCEGATLADRRWRDLALRYDVK
jgi:hypothetical protein